MPDWLSPGFLAIGGLVLVGLIAVFVFVRMNSDDNGETGELSVSDSLKEHRADLPLDMAKGTKLGSDDAPLKISMFEDFQCPYCLRFSAWREPDIVADYVKAGKVQIIFEHYPLLGQESLRAAVASECAAGQDKFWPYQNKLFQVQADAGQASNEKLNVGRFSDAKLREYAADLGLDVAKYDACMAGSDALTAVQDDLARARSLGLQGTPSFLINGRPLSGSPGSDEEWKRLLDDQLAAVATAAASASPATSPTAGATAAASSPTAAPTATRTQ
ncbi:MAG: DsbA family protein [SAR202 cluster bacterium]|nr:DsbA family protein [SAR202 cluster bacterium]